MKSFDVTAGLRPAVYGLVIVAWVTAIGFAVRALRSTRRAAAAAAAAAAPTDRIAAEERVDEPAIV